MADKNTKFKDFKKGDHLYWVNVINYVLLMLYVLSKRTVLHHCVSR